MSSEMERRRKLYMLIFKRLDTNPREDTKLT